MKKQVSKAQEKLIEKGICTRDGNGDPDVEALFQCIAIARQELVELRHQIWLGQASTDFLWSKVNRILNWL